jgi:hypothetical protein
MNGGSLTNAPVRLESPTYVRPTYVRPTYVRPTYVRPTYVCQPSVLA